MYIHVHIQCIYMHVYITLNMHVCTMTIKHCTLIIHSELLIGVFRLCMYIYMHV